MMFQGYVVANKGKPNEQLELVYFGEYEHFARNKIRNAIASGFDYGYIKQGFDTIAYLTEKSFLQVAK
jgi:hypothetical protein